MFLRQEQTLPWYKGRRWAGKGHFWQKKKGLHPHVPWPWGSAAVAFAWQSTGRFPDIRLSAGGVNPPLPPSAGKGRQASASRRLHGDGHGSALLVDLHVLPRLGLPSWCPPTFTPTGVLAWCLEDSGVGGVGVLNDGIWGDELFLPRSSALPGHQVLLTWPQPVSTQAACWGRRIGLWCLQDQGWPEWCSFSYCYQHSDTDIFRQWSLCSQWK